MRRPMQYLGRLSHSLYLLHGVVGWVLLSIALGKSLKPAGL
jgi:peptidoglycan/LPS O-acetylase OafA/YrhL